VEEKDLEEVKFMEVQMLKDYILTKKVVFSDSQEENGE
jgi:hypothetical protein